MITDTDAKIEYINSAFEKITGYSAEEVIGLNPRLLESDKTPKSHYQSLWQTITAGHQWQGELQSRKKNGEIFWEHVHFAPVIDDTGTIRHYLAVKEDITRRKQQEEQILRQAHFDTLTELPNRFLSLDRLSQLISEARRNDELVAILFLDLDDFKKINDSLGHETGDKLLVEVAERLSNMLRAEDTVGRLGGDEFIVLLGGLTDAVGVQHIADSLLNRFRDAFTIDGRELMLTISIGIAIFPEDGNSVSDLLRNADSAMYHSKELGRNTYSYFTDAMNRDVSRQLAIEEQLHGALDRGEFNICYQPQVDINSRKIIGTEALLRWCNPALGNVSPLEFIPIAEQTGLIVPLGRFVLNEALDVTACWQKEYNPKMRVAINLSPRQFRDPDLISCIQKAIRQSGVSSSFLELEITEGVLMSGHAYINDALVALNDMGVSIAMDDFGTGYSSLSYLRNYPFNVLKVDKSFVRDITDDSADWELINAIVAMAHGLNLKVVAEGVETEEQFNSLKELGCDCAQGLLFSEPVSMDQMTEMLKNVM
jgi:diguanylate cyclase (GGDEF)-like protein/PAS domain S-box-containing protein